MPEERTLEVWCFDLPAGTLVDAQPNLRFSYHQDWIDGGMPPLSQSLPLRGEYEDAAASAFFGGLLPEGVPRELLARRLGVSERNDFSLLAAVGGDTAGAVSLMPPGQKPEPVNDSVLWLDDRDLVSLIDELPTRPMHADEHGEYRLSLAGVQDKLPVVVGPDGRIGLTKGRTPSTHILKTAIKRLDNTVINEAFCLALGRDLGMDVVSTEPRRVQGREFLLVERYDRIVEADSRRRLHQEDFCQALSIQTERKYEAEGGPSLADCFALLRRSATVPAQAVVKLLDDVALSFLVGNHDAHGKNYSLLYLPATSKAVLAPAYDVISTFAYSKSHNLSRKMAMKIGGEYRPDYVRSRHVDRLLAETGLGAAAAKRRLRAHAAAAPKAARARRTQFAGAGWDVSLLDIVIEIVDQRSEWLTAITAPSKQSSHPGSTTAPQLPDPPDNPANDARDRVAPGQLWRDSVTEANRPRLVTVESIGADGTARGSVRRYGSETDEPGEWDLSDFDAFALLKDPHWARYTIAAKLAVDDPRAKQLTRLVGDLEGARSHTMATKGLGGPESSWGVIAPTETHALELVRRTVGPDVAVRPAMGWQDEP